LKNQKPIDSQIQFAEQELAALDEKRKELQARIEQLKGQRQSIADEQLPFDRLFKSNVTNDSNEEQKIALFRSLFRGREDVYPSTQDCACSISSNGFDGYSGAFT
jgi:hypothetical protein